jgi:hypothetical protein
MLDAVAIGKKSRESTVTRMMTNTINHTGGGAATDDNDITRT